MENRNRTNRERDILDRAARVLPQGSLGNLNYDLIINKGMGSHIWDESGNEYIDYLLGSGPMLVGRNYLLCHKRKICSVGRRNR